MDLLKKAGCLVLRLNEPVDLLVGFRTSWYLIEIKSHPAHTKKGKLRPSQEDFRDACANKALPMYVFHSLDDAQAFLGR